MFITFLKPMATLALHITVPRLQNLSYYLDPGRLALLGTELGKPFCRGGGKVAQSPSIRLCSICPRQLNLSIPWVNLSNYNMFGTRCSFQEWRIGWKFWRVFFGKCVFCTASKNARPNSSSFQNSCTLYIT